MVNMRVTREETEGVCRQPVSFFPQKCYLHWFFLRSAVDEA